MTFSSLFAEGATNSEASVGAGTDSTLVSFTEGVCCSSEDSKLAAISSEAASILIGFSEVILLGVFLKWEGGITYRLDFFFQLLRSTKPILVDITPPIVADSDLFYILDRRYWRDR